MKSFTSILRKSLIAECEIKAQNESTIFIIKNSQNEGDLKEVRLDAKRDDNSFFIFSFDKREIQKLHNTDLITIDWIKKRSDCIVYKYKNSLHYFIIIEVKSNKAGGAKNQLNSMEAFLHYLMKAIQINYENIKNLNNVRVARLLITSRALFKPFVKTKSPEQLVPFNPSINANEIQYRKDEKKAIPIELFMKCKFKGIYK